MLALRYGTDSSLSFELDRQRLIAVCEAPHGAPLQSLRDAARAALADPLGYPPLVQAVLPGDTVVLALGRGVPGAAAIVAQTVEQLLAAGIAPEHITLVCAPHDGAAGADPRALLPEEIRSSVGYVVHDPADRRSLSYLAAAADARPIYINRKIHDADFVILLGVLRLADSLGYHGISSDFFPAFSDPASQERFRAPKAGAPEERRRLRREVDEAAWLLGARFTIQVVPGSAGEILHVLAGDLDAVFGEGTRLCDAAWNFSVPERAELVVATIEGDSAEQTWENVARALSAASCALAENGSVVICSDLAQRPGPGLARLAASDNPQAALKRLARERPSDALPAAEIVAALERGKVYLVSRLDDEAVEELGLLPLSPGAVSRVAQRHKSCIVLANAQYARARPSGETVEGPAAAGRKSRS
jgi:nickel-dependent lactate racemase